MKIDNDNPNIRSGASDPLAAPAPAAPVPAAAEGASRTAAPTPQADQLTLSAEARLLQAAADKSGDPGVRADLVARMRELLERGAIGEDASRLAEALIDDVLKNK